MSKVIKFTDMAVFQPSTLHYMKQLKADGSKFNFVKLTEGNNYVNPSAASQISNSLAVWGDVGLYHFWHGESASFFIHEAKRFGMDFATTKVALDVEASDLPTYCTNGINEFESQLIKAGFKAPNIWTYVSKSWIDEGRVNTARLKYGFVWVAYYPYNSVYMDNAIKPNSDVLPRYNAVQFSGLGSQDWSYDFTGSMVNNPKSKAKPKKKVIHKPKLKPKAKPAAKKTVNHYLSGGQTFEVICNGLSGYRDPELDIKNGFYLTKGSRIQGQVLRCINLPPRVDTPIGWFSANTKFLKAVK